LRQSNEIQEVEMPIGRGGGISFAAEQDGDGLTPPPESPVETPTLDTSEANESLPVSSFSDGWVIGG
jgi:hypothetical protein